MSALRDRLEHHQVFIYFGAVLLGAVLALTVPGTQALEPAINPALALMLFVTFLQVPLAKLGRAFTQWRFVGALLLANFVLVPLLAALLLQGLPAEPLLQLGVLLVLLAPNLSERRAQRKASFAAPQTESCDAGLPGAKRRDADNRVAFFGLRFLCEQER